MSGRKWTKFMSLRTCKQEENKYRYNFSPMIRLWIGLYWLIRFYLSVREAWYESLSQSAHPYGSSNYSRCFGRARTSYGHWLTKTSKTFPSTFYNRDLYQKNKGKKTYSPPQSCCLLYSFYIAISGCMCLIFSVIKIFYFILPGDSLHILPICFL